MSDDMSRHDAPLPDASRHTLSVDEAAALFVAAGVPKARRTVQRYCRDGILDCIRTDAELGDKYLIDRASVDRRIDDLKKFQELMAATSVATRPDTTGHDTSRPDTTRHDATRRDSVDENGTPRIKELEAEVFNLRIDNRAKEIVINQLVDERRGFLGQITKQATRIGELSTKLLQLASPAPRDEPAGGRPPVDMPEDLDTVPPEGDNPPPEFDGPGVEWGSEAGR
jgi:hypothetical protein